MRTAVHRRSYSIFNLCLPLRLWPLADFIFQQCSKFNRYLVHERFCGVMYTYTFIKFSTFRLVLYNAGPMKETPRRITATSSSNEISTDQLGNRVLVKGIGVTPPAHTPFYKRFLGQIFKDDVNGFSSLDICFIEFSSLLAMSR